MDYIILDSDSLKELKSRYEHALRTNNDKLWFQDSMILVSFAKYVIMYGEGRLEKVSENNRDN